MKNFVFHLVLRSICTTLPAAKLGCISQHQMKNFVFHLVLRSICTTLPAAKLGCILATPNEKLCLSFGVALDLH
ncbi:MAG: hypothetical protein IJ613_02160 [Muribaculaceae bacterium]|nr:hypothetical protein [Muribaculaceae bacterium]